MRHLRKYISIGLWLYGAAIVIPDDTVDRTLPTPAAAVINGALGLVEQAAAEGFDVVRGRFGEAPAASD